MKKTLAIVTTVAALGFLPSAFAATPKAAEDASASVATSTHAGHHAAHAMKVKHHAKKKGARKHRHR